MTNKSDDLIPAQAGRTKLYGDQVFWLCMVNHRTSHVAWDLSQIHLKKNIYDQNIIATHYRIWGTQEKIEFYVVSGKRCIT